MIPGVIETIDDVRHKFLAVTDELCPQVAQDLQGAPLELYRAIPGPLEGVQLRLRALSGNPDAEALRAALERWAERHWLQCSEKGRGRHAWTIQAALQTVSWWCQNEPDGKFFFTGIGAGTQGGRLFQFWSHEWNAATETRAAAAERITREFQQRLQVYLNDTAMLLRSDGRRMGSRRRTDPSEKRDEKGPIPEFEVEWAVRRQILGESIGKIATQALGDDADVSPDAARKRVSAAIAAVLDVLELTPRPPAPPGRPRLEIRKN